MRRISYAGALNEALSQEMERDASVFVYGIGVPDHVGIFGTTTGLSQKFGPERCFDTPLCEDTMTGFGLGAAINGLRPVHAHIRVDFVLLAMNQLVNMISSFTYGTGGKAKVPLTIRAVIGRGWGQGYQHSKALHSYFAHVPGLKVVAPTTPSDAKGLLTAAIRDDNPTLVLEHRWLYWAEEDVPEEQYEIPFGKARILRPGKDLTIIGTSWLNVEALAAAEILKRHGLEIEVLDPRCFSPLDGDAIEESVTRTGHCMVADNDWTFAGFSAELASVVNERCFGKLKTPVSRVGWPHVPCPTGRELENEFYPNAVTIVRAVERQLKLKPLDLGGDDFYSHERRFKGPF
jgi:pyruvate/2-oxoglutarate/acetoin dehydrogenase E1 component